MRRCTLRRMQEQLPHHTGWLADIGRNPGLCPSAVLQLGKVPAALADGSGARLLAFHGTPWDNLHSILHHGLINASGTRLERTGASSALACSDTHRARALQLGRCPRGGHVVCGKGAKAVVHSS